MTALVPFPHPEPSDHTPRQRERRQAVGELLTSVMRLLDRRADVSLMRGAFEDMLRRTLRVRSVHLRDAGSRWAGRVDVPLDARCIALEVPGADPGSPGVLEATFDAGCRPGDWDVQMLGLAAQVGALVLEIERSRLQLVRAELLSNSRPKRDGAAPLIGSAPAMLALRSTIERVAGTDFTVLLEGTSDPW